MRGVLIASAVLGIAGVAHADPTFYLTTGFTQGHLFGVSNEGTAVGLGTAGFAIWNPAAAVQTDIGGVASSGQPSISDDGRYIGGSAAGSDGRTEMGRYDRTTSTWTTFGGTGGYSGSTRSSAWGISPDGSTVVGFGYGPYTGSGSGTSTGIHPAVWKEGVGMIDLAFHPSATSTNRVEAATNGGAYAGLARFPSSSSAPVGVIWGSGVGSQQGMTYSTGYLGEAVEISADGRYVAGHGSTLTRDGATPPASRPYIFDVVSNSISFIPSIAGLNGNDAVTGIGSIDGLMTGLTGDGQTSVGFFRGRNTGNTPLIDKIWGFMWTSDGGVVSFDAFAASIGAPDTESWYYVPTAISNGGSVIAGYRYPRAGGLTFESFMITNVPAPGTLALLGAPLFFARRRR